MLNLREKISAVQQITMTESLLLLPVATLVSIVSNWINDDDVCYLDSAVCNSLLRRSLMLALKRLVTDNINFEQINQSQKHEWAILRGIRLKSVRLTQKDLKHDPYCMFVAQNVNVLEAPASTALASFLRKRNVRVETLKLTSKTNNKAVESILKAAGGVLVLNLSGCSGLQFPVVDAILQHCPNLKRFSEPLNFNASCLLNCPTLETMNNCPVDTTAVDYNQRNILQVVMYYDLTKTDYWHESRITIDGKYYYVTRFVFRGHEVDYPMRIQLSDQRVKPAHLISIDLTNTEIEKGVAEAFFKRAKSLRHINLNGSSAARKSVVEIIADNCRYLESIRVNFSSVYEDELMSLIHRCRDLKLLSFYRAEVSCRVLRLWYENKVLILQKYQGYSLKIDNERHLKRLTYASDDDGQFWYKQVFTRGLLKLIVHDHELSHYDVECLVSQSPLLTCVSLLGKKHEPSTIIVLAQLPHLVSCTILGSAHATNNAIVTLLTDKPNFVKLALPQCIGFTGDILSTIARMCPDLTYVNVSHSRVIQSGDVIELLKGCLSLHSLDLHSCEFVDVSFLADSLKTRSMRLLNLHGCISLDYTSD